jgi:hypothetical protein
MNAFIAGPDNSMDWVAAEWSDGGERPWDIEAPSMP